MSFCDVFMTWLFHVSWLVMYTHKNTTNHSKMVFLSKITKMSFLMFCFCVIFDRSDGITIITHPVNNMSKNSHFWSFLSSTMSHGGWFCEKWYPFLTILFCRHIMPWRVKNRKTPKNAGIPTPAFFWHLCQFLTMIAHKWHMDGLQKLSEEGSKIVIFGYSKMYVYFWYPRICDVLCTWWSFLHTFLKVSKISRKKRFFGRFSSILGSWLYHYSWRLVSFYLFYRHYVLCGKITPKQYSCENTMLCR